MSIQIEGVSSRRTVRLWLRLSESIVCPAGKGLLAKVFAETSLVLTRLITGVAAICSVLSGELLDQVCEHCAIPTAGVCARHETQQNP